MGRSDPPDTSRDPRQCHPSEERPPPARRVSLFEVLWCFVLVAVPLGSGLAVNAALGWWPGLGAFLVAAVITGVAAYRTDPRRHRH
jgi:4-hydroxybenzoate polyprenyltransferase